MRTILCGLFIISSNLLVIADEPTPKQPKLGSKEPSEPTGEQIAAAKEAYGKHGATYFPDYDSHTKQTTHAFQFPRRTTDDDLKGMIDLPFRFALNFRGAELTDACVVELRNLTNLTELSLWGARITDDGLTQLKGLKNLTHLNLWASSATDDGVQQLREALPNCDIVKFPDRKKAARLGNLKPAETADQIAGAKDAYAKLGARFLVGDYLDKRGLPIFAMRSTTSDADLKKLPAVPFEFVLNLRSTKVTDAGLKELKTINNLSALNLTNTKVTDVGLKELKDLKNLFHLKLSFTEVTDAGVKELQAALPKCTIVR